LHGDRAGRGARRRPATPWKAAVAERGRHAVAVQGTWRAVGSRSAAAGRQRRAHGARGSPTGAAGRPARARGSVAVARGPGLHNRPLCKARPAGGPRRGGRGRVRIMCTLCARRPLINRAQRVPQQPARSGRQPAELARSRRSGAQRSAAQPGGPRAPPPGPRAPARRGLIRAGRGRAGDPTQARSAFRSVPRSPPPRGQAWRTSRAPLVPLVLLGVLFSGYSS